MGPVLCQHQGCHQVTSKKLADCREGGGAAVRHGGHEDYLFIHEGS